MLQLFHFGVKCHTAACTFALSGVLWCVLQMRGQEKKTQIFLDRLLFTRFPQLQFEYRDPEKNFDRSKVYGPVATLIQIKDVKTATALEVSAGGKVRKFNFFCHNNDDD